MSDSAALILGCKEFRCGWDPDAAIYQTTDRLGRVVWERKTRCGHCGSVKIQRFRPDLRLEPLGAPRYIRPEGWYEPELKFYWGRARAERVARGFLPLPDGSS